MKDLPKIKANLEHFEKHKPKLANKDIGSYKTPQHLKDAVMPHTGIDTGHGSYLIHNNNGLTVHRIETHQGAIHHGTGTDWCTSKKNANGLSHFDHYNAKGPLYIVHDQHSGGKYQFQFENDEFRNAADSSKTLPEVVNRIPELRNVQEFKNHPSKHREAFEHPHETHQRVDKELDKALAVHKDIRKRQLLSDIHQSMVYDIPEIDKKVMAHYDTHIKDHPDADRIERSLIHSPHVTQDQKAHIWRNTKSPYVRHVAIEHALPHEKDEVINDTIDKIKKVPENVKYRGSHSSEDNHDYARFVEQHGNNDHIDNMIIKHHKLLQPTITERLASRITSATAHKVFKETDSDSVRSTMLHHWHTPAMVQMGLKHESADTRMSSARRASEEQLHGMLKKEKNIHVLESLAEHSPKSVLDKLVKHENPFVRQSVAIHSNYKEHLDALQNDPNRIVSDTVKRIKTQRKKYKME